jgi:hypothetical protein
MYNFLLEKGASASWKARHGKASRRPTESTTGAAFMHASNPPVQAEVAANPGWL